jgi:hypothetical protein
MRGRCSANAPAAPLIDVIEIDAPRLTQKLPRQSRRGFVAVARAVDRGIDCATSAFTPASAAANIGNAMQQSPSPKRKPPNNAKEAPISLALRINRAAGDVNPVLMVFALGLLILNITFYLGMSLSREAVTWPSARQIGSSSAPPGSSLSQLSQSAPVSAVGGN